MNKAQALNVSRGCPRLITRLTQLLNIFFSDLFHQLWFISVKNFNVHEFLLNLELSIVSWIYTNKTYVPGRFNTKISPVNSMRGNRKEIVHYICMTSAWDVPSNWLKITSLHLSLTVCSKLSICFIFLIKKKNTLYCFKHLHVQSRVRVTQG